MKIDSVVSIEAFMRYCRLPVYFKSDIRSMRVGDTFLLGQYKEEIENSKDLFYVAEAWIERQRGIYQFYGTWTFPTKANRPLIMAFGEFKVKTGGVIEFDSDKSCVREFALISRYLDLLVRKMTKEQLLHYVSNHGKPLNRGVLLDDQLIERKVRAKYVDGVLTPFNVDYKKNAPTPQLAAIVNAGIALGQI